MAKRVCLFLAVAVLTAGPAAAATPAAAQDAKSVLQAAAANMGVTNLKSIQYSGNGWVGAVGQNYTPADDWPHFEMTSYTRTIDFDTNSSKEEMVLRQGNYIARGGGGTPIIGEQRRTQLASGGYAWNMQGNTVVPQPEAAELRRLEIYLTPFGFLKAAMAGNPTAVTRNEYGGRVTVVSFTAFGKYRVNGTITAQNIVQRVQTWVPNPVAGDLYYENVYTNYRNIGGMKLPMHWHQHQDYDDGGLQPNVQGGDHAFDLETLTDVKMNLQNASLTVPDVVKNTPIPPVKIETQKLADGVWLIGGGTHNSVAVEFKDYAAVIEAPLDEERSLAVIAETNRLIPNKPIRYVVNTHHHWDHLGGIRTYVHEGATVITYDGNLPFYREYLTPARRWTLKPDRFYLNPPEEWSEGSVFEPVHDKSILGDETRTIEIHRVQGLQHAVGMLMVYFPKEKIVVEADLYTPPAPGAAAPAPNASARNFYENLQRLKLNVDTIVPIHGRPGPISEFVQIMNAAPK
jgi:glyoxylase-like metal-dependent hydrolase (beta-lactamase superfamily II)